MAQLAQLQLSYFTPQTKIASWANIARLPHHDALRSRMAVKGARRECKHRVDDAANGIGILPSDYIDRGDGLLIGLDTFTTANRHLLLPKTCPVRNFLSPSEYLSILSTRNERT